MKTEPWSVNISSGNPVLEKISIMASATVSASNLCNATASGYLDARHIHVSIYLLPDLLLVKGPTRSKPDLLLGKGPTRSKAILEKGVEITGSGQRGAR